MTRSQLLQQAVATLDAAGVSDPARDARILLRAASGLDAASFAAGLTDAVPPAEAQRFQSLTEARRRRQPVSQILGKRAFWGRDFLVTPAVLDPRPETETLIAAALDGAEPERILDLGTGSGAILVTLLAEWPNATGLGVDISQPALSVAARNARAHGVVDRVEFRISDWFSDVDGRFDLILCNPPYIAASALAGLAPEVLEWEPRDALTPGEDALSVYRQLSCNLELYMTKRGRTLFELGADQAESVEGIYSKINGWRSFLKEDLDDRPRCLIVHR